VVYPIILAIIGKVEWGVIVSSYLGIFFLGASIVAIGIFSSAVTKNQIGGYILAFFIVFVFSFIGKFLRFTPSNLVSTLSYAGFDSHFSNFAKGIIDLRDIIYFFSLIGMFLFFAYNTYRRFRLRPLRGFYAGAIIIGIILINYVCYFIFFRFDLTSNNRYSLTKQSIQITRSLEKPLFVKAYISRNLPFPYSQNSKYIIDFLNEYKSRSRGKIKIEFINPSKRRQRREAVQAGIQPLTFTEMGSSSYQAKEGYLGLVMIYGNKKEVIPIIGNVQDLEYDITRRIRKLAYPEKKTIVIEKGHNEIEMMDQVKKYLKEDYDIDEINVDSTDIPLKASSFIMIAPQGNITKEGQKRIDDYLMNGGNIGFFLNRYTIDKKTFIARENKLASIDSLLQKYGLHMDKGIVCDLQNEQVMLVSKRGNFSIQSPVPFAPFVLCTNYDQRLKGPRSVLFPFVSAVSGGEILASSWYLNPLGGGLRPPKDKKFNTYPLVVYKKGIHSAFSNKKNPNARVLLVGSGNLVSPEYISQSSAVFFLNLVDWLTEDVGLITIRAKNTGLVPLKPIGQGTKLTTKFIVIILPILIVLLYGYYRRRKRYA